LSASPFFIAIAGGTGSGKTTLAKKIHEHFPNSILISQDSYYKDLSHLPFESRKINNFDHPNSLEFSLLKKHLIDLKQGLSIEVPCYDFCQHARISKVELINPANIVIVEGILLLSQPELLSLFDLKIFVDTDSDIRVLRRIERDIEERGRDLQNIREQYLATVKPMHDAFVEPSKKFADIIVPAENINDMALSLILAKISQHEI
jgi:uridine kinase